METLVVLRIEDGAGIVACPRCGGAAYAEGADHVAPEYGLPEGSRLLRAYHLSDSTSGPDCPGGYGFDPWY
jgi:hypothetical protein